MQEPADSCIFLYSLMTYVYCQTTSKTLIFKAKFLDCHSYRRKSYFVENDIVQIYPFEAVNVVSRDKQIIIIQLSQKKRIKSVNLNATERV